MSLEFLLEIGTEEIPHWMIPSALEALTIEFLALLGEYDFEVGGPLSNATPRRLVLWHPGLKDRQDDSEEMITGPPKSAGATAVTSFAKKHGTTPDNLETVNTAKGEYLAYRKRAAGRATLDLLADDLPKLILGIQWPKTMYWTGGKTGPRFIRPIRWIVALLGDEVVPFEIAGVKSGRITRGHRALGSASIPVTIPTHHSELAKHFVILNEDERREKIRLEAGELGAKLDTDLLETLTFITEYPTAIRGDFDPAYLELPAEVLTTVMRHHQKYFSVEAEPGKLAPHFVAVMNIPADPEGLVKHGNERVLRARFNDARFFWDVDQQKKLADRVDDLAKITFQAKLGSYKEKTERIVRIVKELGGDANAQRAALLCKCDLTTEMVKEFTDLQGLIGGLYAGRQGEPEAVSYAIYEHYKPVSMEDSIPHTREGRILALADKLDTLRECFKIGMAPTGSKDPFALRRAAQGVVKILVEAGIDLRLSHLAEGELLAFLNERIDHFFREVRGYKYDEVNAVLGAAGGIGTLPHVELRLRALADVRLTADFEPLAASFKRIKNILTQANFVPRMQPLEASMLEAGPERDLYDASQRVYNESKTASYRDQLSGIASLRPKVDLFFDKVMVNAPDPKIRANRLTLLHQLLTEFSTIADFSEIVTSGDQK